MTSAGVRWSVTTPSCPAHGTPSGTLGTLAVSGHRHTPICCPHSPSCTHIRHPPVMPGLCPPSTHPGARKLPPLGWLWLTSVSKEAAGRLSHSGSWSWVWGWIPEGWLCDSAWEDTGRGALRRRPQERLYIPVAARILLSPGSCPTGTGMVVVAFCFRATQCQAAEDAGHPFCTISTATSKVSTRILIVKTRSRLREAKGLLLDSGFEPSSFWHQACQKFSILGCLQGRHSIRSGTGTGLLAEERSPEPATVSWRQGRGRTSLRSRTVQLWRAERSFRGQKLLQEATRRKARGPGREKHREAETTPLWGYLQPGQSEALAVGQKRAPGWTSGHTPFAPVIPCSNRGLAAPLLPALTSPSVMLSSSGRAEAAILSKDACRGVGGSWSLWLTQAGQDSCWPGRSGPALLSFSQDLGVTAQKGASGGNGPRGTEKLGG